MSDLPRIVFFDANNADVELAGFALRNTLNDCDLDCADDATSLVAVFKAAQPDVAIISPRPGFSSFEAILELVRNEFDHCAIIVFGHENELVQHCLNPGLKLDGMVRKSSAGFLELANIVKTMLLSVDTAQPGGVDTRAELANEPAAVAADDVLPHPSDTNASIDLTPLPLPAFSADDHGTVTKANDRFLDLTGTARHTQKDININDLCADHKARKTWFEFRDGHHELGELRLKLNNDEIRRVHIVRDEFRCPSERFVGVVTARVNPPINVVTAPGRPASRGEIHDIALVFSHDLKEPLQQISRLAQRLDERASETGSNSERSQLTTQLGECSKRAMTMVESLLEYLSISARNEETGRIDLNHCLEQALDSLRQTIDEADARITTEPLPQITADAYQIQHLFQNLISNAIKFRSREAPSIRIDAERVNKMWRIRFRDNGIGIAESFRERVFDMGKRLHTREEFPGNGIGLTLCRRIVERHGGTIRIEAGETTGSVVVVELPVAANTVTRLA